jgi:hypothetical protein
MARISPTSPARRSTRTLATLAVGLLLVSLIIAALFIVPGIQSVGLRPSPEVQQAADPTVGATATTGNTVQSTEAPTPTTQVSEASVPAQPEIEYTTESGKGSSEGVVNSPLKIAVRVPEPNGHPETALSASVSIQFLDEKGQPAQYGGKPADPFTMLPSYDTDGWLYFGSVPERPGTYYARVVMGTHSTEFDTPVPEASKEYIFDLKSAPLHALAESGPPLASGYVFSRDSNLWLMSTDTKRQRRLTFFTPPDEYAYEPVWSPDGKQIAFTFSPKTDQSEIPSTDIWTVKPDGSGARELVKHGDNEELRDPAWSSDGRYLYFTVEQIDPNQTTYNALGVPQSGVRIDRLDTKTGARSQWVDSGEMPASGDSPNKMVYVEDTYEASTDPNQVGLTGQQLVSVNADTGPPSGRSHRKVLVDDKTYLAMDYPTVSPDGKWIAFAAIYVPGFGGHKAFDLLSWLGLKPEVASAHGLPWDLFMVPAQGGKPVKLNKVSDDQPRPAWLNNTTLTYMGSYWMYNLEIDASGKPLSDPTQIHEGVPHGGLSWHGP